MQTRNPFLDEFAKLSTSAMGLAQAAGEEAKAALRAQSDRVVAEMDLVRRDEFDALKAEIAALRAEVAALKNPSTVKPKKPQTGTSPPELILRTQRVEPNPRTRLPSFHRRMSRGAAPREIEFS